MAKGKKFGGRDFKKGQSGNPNGAPRIPEDIKIMRKLTRIEFDRIVNKFLYSDKAEISRISSDPKTPLMELLIASIIHKAISQGDERRLNFFLDRLLGKVKDQVEMTGKDGSDVFQSFTQIVKEIADAKRNRQNNSD